MTSTEVSSPSTSLPPSSTTAMFTPEAQRSPSPASLWCDPEAAKTDATGFGLPPRITIGQRSPPMCSWYHIHASGLIGSPTVPSKRSDDKSCFAGSSVSLHERSDRSRCGIEDGDLVLFDDLPEPVVTWVVGTPSYMTWVAPFASGPYTMYEWPVIQPTSPCTSTHLGHDEGRKRCDGYTPHE